MKGRFRYIYLNVPEPLAGPRFCIDSCEIFAVTPGNFLRIPLKMPYDLWVNEVVHHPIPQRTAPGVV